MGNPLLDKIAGARASGSSNNIKDGIYLFTVNKIIVEKKESGNMFIVELMVDESESIAGMYEKNGTAVWDAEGASAVKANAVGTMPGYVVNLDTNKSAAGNAKAFVLALVGANEEDVSTDDFVATLTELCSKEQPGKGMQIRAQTSRKAIKSGKNAGTPFVGVRWTNAESTPEQIAARRAALEKVVAKAA